MRYIEKVFVKLYRRLINDLVGMRIRQQSRQSSINNNNKPLMIVGPNGVGKNTMINRLKAKFKDKIYKLPLYTTRSMRNEEINGEDYYFITKEQFSKMKNEGELFGIQEHINNYYALNKNKLKEILEKKEKIVILNYNIEGANAIKDELEINFVAIMPPCEASIKERLIKKGIKSEDIGKLMEKAIKEIQLINEANYIKYRFVNEDEDKTYNKLEKHLKEIYPQLN